MTSPFLPDDILADYECYQYAHAASILNSEFSDQLDEIVGLLRQLRISHAEIRKPGGSKSDIAKKIEAYMNPLGWNERNLGADLEVYEAVMGRRGGETYIKNKKALGSFEVGTHKVDLLKGRIAFDLEWNSKDQTYDRDLFAFAGYFRYNVVSVGVLLTRSSSLQSVFKTLGKKVADKYGASTTHMDKLIPRLNAGRSGGCPVLAIGIKPARITP